MKAIILCGNSRIKAEVRSFNVSAEEIEFVLTSGLKVFAYKRDFRDDVFARLSNTLKGLPVSNSTVIANINVPTGEIFMDSQSSSLKEFDDFSPVNKTQVQAPADDNAIFTQEPQGATHIKPDQTVLERYEQERKGIKTTPEQSPTS